MYPAHPGDVSPAAVCLHRRPVPPSQTVMRLFQMLFTFLMHRMKQTRCATAVSAQEIGYETYSIRIVGSSGKTVKIHRPVSGKNGGQFRKRILFQDDGILSSLFLQITHPLPCLSKKGKIHCEGCADRDGQQRFKPPFKIRKNP